MFAAGAGKRVFTGSNITRYYRRLLSSTTHQGGTTPGKLSEKIRKDGSDRGAVEGSGGGYGGPEISDTINEAVESSPRGGDTFKDKRGAGERQRRGREVEDAADDIAEIAKAGVVGAVEVGLKLGEMAKQTMDGMWDVAKKTAEGVRDTVADDREKNCGEDDPWRSSGPRGYK